MLNTNQGQAPEFQTQQEMGRKLTSVIALPNGTYLAIRQDKRKGFTIPEGTLLGVYETYEEAEEACSRA